MTSICSLVILLYGTGATILLIPTDDRLIKLKEDPTVEKLLTVLFIIMVFMMAFCIVKINKSKIIITHDNIQLIGVFKNTELKFYDIEGFNTTSVSKFPFLKFLGIESKTKGKKAIVITNLFENFEEIKSQLRSKVMDLDAEKTKAFEAIVEEEKKKILSNQDFGFSVQDRKNKLKRAEIISKLLMVFTAVLGIWVFFYPKPYKYAIIACISLPIISLVVVQLFRGLIKVNDRDNSAYPSAAFGIIFPGLLLFLRVVTDFSICDYSNAWLPAMAITIVFMGMIIMVSREFSFDCFKSICKILGFTTLIFAYGYSSLISLNCVFDESKPLIYETRIVDKKINGGKYRTYDLYLSPWGAKTEIQKVSIDKDFYHQLNYGEEMSIYQFKGKFDIPWLVVDYARN